MEKNECLRCRRRGAARLIAASAVAVAAVAVGPRIDAQEAAARGWLRAGAGLAALNGEFEATRDSGKHVTTDLEGGFGFRLGLAWEVAPRWIVALDGAIVPGVTLQHLQRFPDGGGWEASGDTTMRSLALTVARRVHESTSWTLDLGAGVALVGFSAMSLPSAGPPWDRTLPLAIDPDLQIAPTVTAAAGLRLSDRLSLELDASLSIARLQSALSDDPGVPGAAGELDLPANPLTLGVRLAWRFR